MASWTTWSLLATFRFVSTHTTPTFPYKLVCSAVILEHFRWRTFRDFHNCLLLLALCYLTLLNRIFSLHHPFGIHHSYWRLISYALSIWASIKALPSPISASSINPPLEKPLRPRKTPILYGVTPQAIVLKCTISNTWLVRLTRRSRVSVWSRCSRLALLYHSRLGSLWPSLALS
jgi:hypothetical protein